MPNFLFLIIFILQIDRSFTEDLCGAECLLLKRFDQLLDVEADNLKSNVKKRETNEYVVFAIDTSNIDPDKDDEFKLIEKDDYDVKLVQNRFCDNKTFAEDSKNTFYFPAYRFVNHRKVLVDIFGTCQKNLTFDQRIRVLDLLVYKYMTTVTRWVTGRYPMTREDQMDHLYKRCIDEDGFGASPAPNHCFFLAAVGYTKNLDENGKIYREITSKFAGHLSVNRMVEDDYPVPLVKNDTIRGIVYNTTTLPSHIVMNALDKIYFNNSDHCFIDWQENFYGIVCFCGKDPKQCQFRPFLSKERVCAVGTSKYWIRNDTKPGADDLTFKFYDNKTFEFKPTIPMNFKENRNYFGSFCTIRYNFNRENITATMPSPSKNLSCPTDNGGFPRCFFDNIVCPRSYQHYSFDTTIDCCCNSDDLCNLDLKYVKFFNQYMTLRNGKPCHAHMHYSIQFTPQNFTWEKNNTIPLCSMHYEPEQGTLYFLSGNNMELLRNEDFEKYKQDGCSMFPIIIKETIFSNCSNDGYSLNDTWIPRPLFLCNCKGYPIGLPGRKNRNFCDLWFNETIGKTYQEKENIAQMPWCRVTEGMEINSYTTMEDFIENSELKMAINTVFCYAEIIATSSTVNETKSHKVMMTINTGIADLKHYGIQCYQLYKAQKNNPLACSTTQSRTLCCALTIGPNQNHSSLFYLAKQQAIDYLSTGYGYSKNYERMVNSTCQRAGISFNANITHCPHAFGCFETHKTHGKRINKIKGCISEIDEMDFDTPEKKAVRACTFVADEIRRKKVMEFGEYPQWDDTVKPHCMETNFPTSDGKANIVVCCCTELEQKGNCAKRSTMLEMGRTLDEVINVLHYDQPMLV